MAKEKINAQVAAKEKIKAQGAAAGQYRREVVKDEAGRKFRDNINALCKKIADNRAELEKSGAGAAIVAAAVAVRPSIFGVAKAGGGYAAAVERGFIVVNGVRYKVSAE